MASFSDVHYFHSCWHRGWGKKRPTLCWRIIWMAPQSIDMKVDALFEFIFDKIISSFIWISIHSRVLYIINVVLNMPLFKFQVSFEKYKTKVYSRNNIPSVIELQCHCWQKLKKKMKDLMRRNSLEQIHKLWWVTRFEESFAAMWLFA